MVGDFSTCSPLAVAALQMQEFFQELTRQGFTERQAIQLLAELAKE